MNRRAGAALALCLAAALAQAGPPRIVTLAPHLAELAYAAGAGDLLVGVSVYSDYPAAAARLPRVGDAFTVDQERLAGLEPDLLLAWESGTPARTVDALRQRGYEVVTVRTRGLDDVGAALRQIGRLAHRRASGEAAARRFETALAGLRDRHRGRSALRVFYQVSSRPVYTVNGQHYISELISICGGQNVFAELDELAPLVSEEAVLAKDPEVLLAGRSEETDGEIFAVWERWRHLAANRLGNRYTVPADLVGRATPRLIRAGEAICDRLDAARARRDGSEGGEAR